jgi:hypothetical protein
MRRLSGDVFWLVAVVALVVAWGLFHAGISKPKEPPPASPPSPTATASAAMRHTWTDKNGLQFEVGQMSIDEGEMFVEMRVSNQGQQPADFQWRDMIQAVGPTGHVYLPSDTCGFIADSHPEPRQPVKPVGLAPKKSYYTNVVFLLASPDDSLPHRMQLHCADNVTLPAYP